MPDRNEDREKMRPKLVRCAENLRMLMDHRAPDVIVANELRLIAKFGAIFLGNRPPVDPPGDD